MPTTALMFWILLSGNSAAAAPTMPPPTCQVVALPSPSARQVLTEKLVKGVGGSTSAVEALRREAKRVAWVAADALIVLQSIASSEVRSDWLEIIYPRIVDKENWLSVRERLYATNLAGVRGGLVAFADRYVNTDRYVVGPGGGFVVSGPFVQTQIVLPPSICMMLRAVDDAEVAALVAQVNRLTLSTDRLNAIRARLEDRSFTVTQACTVERAAKYRDAQEAAVALLTPRVQRDEEDDGRVSSLSSSFCR